MARNRKMTPAEKFFYKHAGFCFDPQTETRAQGKRRCAVEMAEAEAYMQDVGWYCEWSEDWEIGSHKDYYGKGSCYEDREPNTCEYCILFDENGDMLASLGCIDDASADYRRVIEAELADEAYSTIMAAKRNDADVYSYCAL
jgi:hypothetical protein